MSSTRIFLVILFVLTLNSCSKDDPTRQADYSYLDESFKQNFVFNEGSYWIYQDQSMNMDSVVLAHCDSGFTSNCPKNACDLNQYVSLTYENVTQGTVFNHYLIFNSIKYNGGGEWGQDGQPIFLVNQEEGYFFNGLLVGEQIDNLLILNEVFYNVQKMSVQADFQYQSEFEYDTDFYFSETVGIVRIVIHDTINGTQTWNLKRRHLEE
ncbi:MAG: hypothetical protein K9J17_11245 [Flavobacteriales bacterium]|nr:hypothetical protein [Flavobacteriales bacterium]